MWEAEGLYGNLTEDICEIRGSLWEAEYRCGKQRISVKSKGSTYMGSRVYKRETECLFGKQHISLESRVHLRESVWEGKVALWEAEDFWDAENLCGKQSIFVESRASH